MRQQGNIYSWAVKLFYFRSCFLLPICLIQRREQPWKISVFFINRQMYHFFFYICKRQMYRRIAPLYKANITECFVSVQKEKIHLNTTDLYNRWMMWILIEWLRCIRKPTAKILFLSSINLNHKSIEIFNFIHKALKIGI